MDGLAGDEPRDVVVGGPRRDKVVVTTAHRGQANHREPDFQEAGKGRADGIGELRAAIEAGRATITAMVVPPGSGSRIAVDRDEDGALDDDETDLGLDPPDPDSRPAPR